jgi:hypothetical protein
MQQSSEMPHRLNNSDGYDGNNDSDNNNSDDDNGSDGVASRQQFNASRDPHRR